MIAKYSVYYSVCTYPYIHGITGYIKAAPLWVRLEFPGGLMPLSEVDCVCPNQHPLWYLACVWKASFTLCFTNKPLQQFINLNSIRGCNNDSARDINNSNLTARFHHLIMRCIA